MNKTKIIYIDMWSLNPRNWRVSLCITISTSFFNLVKFTMNLTRAELNVYTKSYLHDTLM